MGEREFFSVVALGQVNDVRQLIQNVNINQFSNELGQTALHIAVSQMDSDMVDFLIRNGADCNAEDEFGSSVLRTAVVYADVMHKNGEQKDYFSIIQWILNHVNEDLVGYRDIVMGLNILEKKKYLTKDDFDLLYKLSLCHNWHIRYAIIRTLDERVDIPEPMIKRITELKDDPDWHVNCRANAFIRERNIKQITDQYSYPIRQCDTLSRHCGLIYCFQYLMRMMIPSTDDTVPLLVEDEE